MAYLRVRRQRRGYAELGRKIRFNKRVEFMQGAGLLPKRSVDYYLDSIDGDNNNNGRSMDLPLESIAEAMTKVGADDMLHVVHGDYPVAAKIDWSFNDAKLIGDAITPNQPHLKFYQTVTCNPMLEISGRGNVFANFTLEHGVAATDLVGALVSGRYNYFENVYFKTPFVAAQDLSTYRGVRINGHNNYFRGCKFGNDGLIRDGANFNVTIEGVANVFEDCLFFATIDGTAPHFLGFCIDSARDCRVTQFYNCRFIAYSADFGVAMAYAIGMGTSIAGALYFDPRCQFVGVTEIVNVARSAHVYYPVVGVTTTATDSMIALRSQGVTT